MHLRLLYAVLLHCDNFYGFMIQVLMINWFIKYSCQAQLIVLMMTRNVAFLCSWYFGTLSREETNTTLQSERDAGVFLVRDSTSIKGDFVLCVK